MFKNEIFDLNQYYLSDLLPYDPKKKYKKQLKNGLKEYLLLCSGAIHAFDVLASNDLEKLDALVGENACQIRAIMISIVASRKLISTASLVDRISRTKKFIYKLLEEKTIQNLMSSKVTLNDVLTKEKLLVSLTFYEIFIIQCFLLTLVKSSSTSGLLEKNILIKEKCFPKKIKILGDVSFSFADNLIRKLRKNVAIQSVNFIRTSAQKTGDKKIIKMLSGEFVINHNNYLPCTPMFWTYKAMLFAAKQENIKLLLHIKLLNNQSAHLDVLNEYWLQSRLTTNDINEKELMVKKIDWSFVENESCIVFQGIAIAGANDTFCETTWMSDLMKLPLRTIILSSAADHRQYPHERDSCELLSLLEDNELESYKSIARRKGFSFENPSSFFIQHVYATSIKASHEYSQNS